MSGGPLAHYFPFFFQGEKESPVWARELLEFYSPSSSLLNHFNQCFPPWIVLYQGEPFWEADASFWPPTKFSGCIVSPSMGDSFCARFTYSSQQLFYVCASPGRERTESLVFVNSCIWSHASISKWTLCFCAGYFFLISPPCRENRRSLCIHFCKWESWDHVITGLQSTLWLHSPGKKGFQINTSESHISNQWCWLKHPGSVNSVKEMLLSSYSQRHDLSCSSLAHWFSMLERAESHEGHSFPVLPCSELQNHSGCGSSANKRLLKRTT